MLSAEGKIKETINWKLHIATNSSGVREAVLSLSLSSIFRICILHIHAGHWGSWRAPALLGYPFLKHFNKISQSPHTPCARVPEEHTGNSPLSSLKFSISGEKKYKNLLWCVSVGWSIIMGTAKSQIRFPVRAYRFWVQNPAWACTGGNGSKFFPHRCFFLLFLSLRL